MERMPHDILKEIFDLLDPIELFSVSMVCKAWNKVASEDIIWMKWTSDKNLKGQYFQWLKTQAAMFASGRSAAWMVDADSLKKKKHDLLRVPLFGSYGVGRTSIMLRFAEDIFETFHRTTITTEFRLKHLEVHGNKWDSSVNNRRTLYHPGADGIMFIYDVSNRKSFDDLESFFREFEARVTGNFVKTIIGNKIDLENRVELAAAHGYRYFEVSAKTGENVSEAFLDMAQEILPHLLPPPVPPSLPLFLQRVTAQPKKEEKKCIAC